MAQASGLTLVPPKERNILVSSTRGVGELISAALDAGARELIVGIGGSATNDGGKGMAEGLGACFLDRGGSPLGPGGATLRHLAQLDLTGFDPRVRRTRILVACDVQNPLTGPDGASVVYGPQKGADPAAVRVLEEALQHYREVLLDTVGVDVQRIPGSGAAGGLGAALVALCGAELRPGIDLVLDAVGFDARLQEADLVITGEGRLDSQTRSGKALAGVLEASRRRGRPVLAIAGSIDGPPREFTGPGGFAEVSALAGAGISVDEAIARAGPLLRQRTTELLRTFLDRL
jgi:glycerate kinase